MAWFSGGDRIAVHCTFMIYEARFSGKMCDLENKSWRQWAFNEQNRHYINEAGTFCSVKMWKHKDTVDSTGELINN